MYEIHVKGDFEAAHRVVDYPGKCNYLHGHSWIVDLYAEGETLDDLGMLVDFKKAKIALAEVLERFDHHYINEIPPFSEGINPTAENLARYIYESLEENPIFNGSAHLTAIRVWESPRACVTYRKR